MSSNAGATAQDGAWKSKEQAEELRYIQEKEQAQLAAIRDQQSKDDKSSESTGKASNLAQAGTAYDGQDFEGGYGGQESLEDRYATTSGEH
ncbi:hypothetical protein K435DRAFT_825236 [Dendrothele bispora CBS 962.96]|uniref:Uncharacterized protein n=1 Tax=Dendrothele bispora (strain CBS 962.96) TaxID=1314807 RepID=A0A4S8MXR4_DENBC|nr:hypothetical protein K435DRAFT_825236 [Dendrothele bispora CBS 962.96]